MGGSGAFRSLLLITCLFLAVWPAGEARAAWPSDGRALCTSADQQFSVVSVPGGSGSTFVAWMDRRSGARFDLYAQRVLGNGNLDPSWPVNGVGVCTAAGDRAEFAMIADGNGGALLAWVDLRSGNRDVYAQHLLVTGVVDPAWPAGGRALCTATGAQQYLALTGDGSGGAFVAWADHRSGLTNDLYAGHVSASGDLDSGYPANGAPLCTAPGGQFSPVAVSVGGGAAVIVWLDSRGGSTAQVRAARVVSKTGVDPNWGGGDVALTSAANAGGGLTAIADPDGGVIVTWEDARGADQDLYAQHVRGDGTPDPSWPADGLAVSATPATEMGPHLVSDGSAGAIVAWWEGEEDGNVHAHHVLGTGTLDPAWPSGGRDVCVAPGAQTEAALASDGAGGAIVAWADERAARNTNIFVHHVLAGGALDGAWPVQGRAVCAATGHQNRPAIASDGSGGAIVAWVDERGFDEDVYANRVTSIGLVGNLAPEIVELSDVPFDQGGKVLVLWNACAIDTLPSRAISSYVLWRQLTTAAATRALGSGAALIAAGEAPEAGPVRGAIRRVTTNAEAEYWEYLVTVPARQIPGYAYTVTTPSDSLPGHLPWNVIIVEAVRADGTGYYDSPPDSAYSVDNLAPAQPAQVTAAYSGGQTHLQWTANSEPDLACYHVYRGVSSDFTPSPGNRIATPTSPNCTDPGPPGGYYKTSAVDVHGNESGFTLTTPTQTTGVDAGGQVVFSLDGARPNPTRGISLRVAFGLPNGSPARLELLDVGGRRVLVRDVGSLGAGRHTVNLAEERRVAPGLYWLQLQQGPNRQRTRVAVIE
jgi:hypothetical protein